MKDDTNKGKESRHSNSKESSFSALKLRGAKTTERLFHTLPNYVTS